MREHAAFSPHRAHLRSYLFTGVTFWVLVRCALVLIGMQGTTPVAAAGIVVLASALTWYDHERARSNYYHATLGLHPLRPLLPTVGLLSALEVALGAALLIMEATQT